MRLIDLANMPACELPGETRREQVERQAREGDVVQLEQGATYTDEYHTRPAYFLRYHGDPILKTPCERIPSADAIPVGLVDAMRRIMHEKKHGIDGVGIAANQCGAGVCVIIARVDGVETVMVNPRIVGRSETMAWRNEGCLSTPKFETSMKRHHWIAVEWEDEAFTTHFRRIGEQQLPSPTVGKPLRFDSIAERDAYVARYEAMPDRQYDARVVQHEVDHLHGKQITDGLTRNQRRKAERLVAEAIGR